MRLHAGIKFVKSTNIHESIHNFACDIEQFLQEYGLRHTVYSRLKTEFNLQQAIT